MSTLPDPLPLFLRVSDVAELLEVDPRTVRRAIEHDGLPAVRIGQTIRIPTATFMTWAQLCPNSSEPDPARSGAASPLHPSDDTEGAHHDGDPQPDAEATDRLRRVSGL